MAAPPSSFRSSPSPAPGSVDTVSRSEGGRRATAAMDGTTATSRWAPSSSFFLCSTPAPPVKELGLGLELTSCCCMGVGT